MEHRACVLTIFAVLTLVLCAYFQLSVHQMWGNKTISRILRTKLFERAKKVVTGVSKESSLIMISKKPPIPAQLIPML